MQPQKIGLTSQQAQEKLSQWGYNEIYGNKVSPFRLIVRQLKKNFILYLLLGAAVISFLVGEHITSYVIMMVIGIVVFVTFLQEYRAEKAISALKQMLTPVSIAVRDGLEKEIPSKELVPDDIVILHTGERIPADCVVVEASNLRLNESMLTGEVQEIKKTEPTTSEISQDNLLFAGTYLIDGRCIAKVLHTGMNTRFGEVVHLISETEKEMPLQTKLNVIAKYMVLVAITVSVLTGAFFLLQQPFTSETFVATLILVIAVSVSAFPEGLPVVLMTTLAVGASRMAKKNAIVNRISIIETLGETTIICADKTGTITKGEMTVKQVITPSATYEVSGTGYTANGSFSISGQQVDTANDKTLQVLFRTAVLCNDAKIARTGEDNIYSVLGSPTEAAILIMAAKARVFSEDLPAIRQEEIPFNSERKYMAVVCQDNTKNVLYAKGAPEIILQKSTHILVDGKVVPFTQEEKERLSTSNLERTRSAYRMLAFGYRNALHTADISVENIIFLGFLALEDPPRDEVRQSIEACNTAGISVKMITGDHKETALAIAQQIGLQSTVLEGQDLDTLTDDELMRQIRQVSIFARVKPEHKLRIVRVLKLLGEIVTMTGDGVNDAPALKEAHIGVAMGRNGTDVSRSVADLTLKDDNFATIVEAIKEGRTIFNNIRKFTSYQLSCNWAELLVLFISALLAPIFGWSIPLILALQILFMNLVTDNLPALTLAFNPHSHDVMLEQPKRQKPIIPKQLLVYTIFSGVVMAMCALVSYYISFNIVHNSLEIARTTAVLCLILLSLANAFHFRSFRHPVFTRSLLTNKYLFFVSLVSICATLFIIYSPLKHAFNTTPLHLFDWLLALILMAIFVAIFDVFKILSKDRNILQV